MIRRTIRRDDMLEDDLQHRLRQLEAECSRLREENDRLRQRSAPAPEAATASATTNVRTRQVEKTTTATVDHTATITTRTLDKSAPAREKLALYRALFRGRTDVFALRWEGRNNRSGYAPACANEWRPDVCHKPKVSCRNCRARDLRPLTEQVLTDHLAGKITVGLYPLRTDETCLLLAIDFDKAAWQDDVSAVVTTCTELAVPYALERSRSGRGAHLWFFFTEPVSAALARRLGCFLLTRTMEQRPELGLDSYDRLFPSQDTLPAGGFGNLIALPLQGSARANDNTVFLDDDLQPYPDQWRFLAMIRRLDPVQLEKLVAAAGPAGEILGITRHDEIDGETTEPWELLPSQRARSKPVPGPFPATLNLTLANMLYIPTVGLSPALRNRLRRLATFPNPEFYQAQAQRFSTYGKPRLISCAVEEPGWLCLPRGCQDELLALCRELGITVHVEDKRYLGQALHVDFHGTLTKLQQEAALAIMASDNGILSATTAFGKTVVAAYCIAQRKVSTLVLVHRRHLLDQWRERLAAFLQLPAKSIGTIGGGKNKPNGVLDIGVIQALNRKGSVNDVVTRYGQIIVDECHHLGAISFEQVLREARARFVLGLTATPTRKDGHQPIIVMQCGPVRFRVDARHRDARLPLEHRVIPRTTPFTPALREKDWTIQELYTLLATDEARNELILQDTRKLLREGRSLLLLTERTAHLDLLAARAAVFVQHCLIFRGGMGVKQRRMLRERLLAVPENEPRLIIATGRYIGEGFDDARLDTLLLTLPISWRGTLQQYAGRLQRKHTATHVVRIYDYVDRNVPMLRRMFIRRERGYRALGYSCAAESAPALF